MLRQPYGQDTVEQRQMPTPLGQPPLDFTIVDHDAISCTVFAADLHAVALSPSNTSNVAKFKKRTMLISEGLSSAVLSLLSTWVTPLRHSESPLQLRRTTGLTPAHG